MGESSPNRLRDELPSGQVFSTLLEVKVLTGQIRWSDYGAVVYANGLSALGISNGGEVAVMKTSQSSPTLRME